MKAKPVVLCHGIFGWGEGSLAGIPYFRHAHKIASQEGRLIFAPSLGPLASLHDQACNLFYHVYGGRVDYGEKHSSKYNHDRYGDEYDGWYPEWSSKKPLDFVAHSMGGEVCRMLQYLLEIKAFRNKKGKKIHTNANWIKSITTISSPHNGSTLCWLLGASQETGLFVPGFNLGVATMRFLQLFAFLESGSTKLKEFYDLKLAHWGFKQGDMNSLDYLKSVINNDRFFNSRDCPIYDLSLNGMSEWNKKLIEYPSTYYFSYISQCSTRIPFTRLSIPGTGTHIVNRYFCYQLGAMKINSTSLPVLKETKWRPNDGIVPTYSQDYPKLGRKAKRNPGIGDPRGYKKGMWYVLKKLKDTDHHEVALNPYIINKRKGLNLYREIFHRIDLL